MPEIIASVKHTGNDEGVLVVLGVTLGVYIFSYTISFAYISYNSSSNIVIPK